MLKQHPNTGVLLGVDDLGAIDCDTDAFQEAFVASDPRFKDTLTSHGQRGCQLFFYATGLRPHHRLLS